MYNMYVQKSCLYHWLWSGYGFLVTSSPLAVISIMITSYVDRIVSTIIYVCILLYDYIYYGYDAKKSGV